MFLGFSEIGDENIRASGWFEFDQKLKGSRPCGIFATPVAKTPPGRLPLTNRTIIYILMYIMVRRLLAVLGTLQKCNAKMQRVNFGTFLQLSKNQHFMTSDFCIRLGSNEL